jgi:hypothetical protein
VVYFEDIGSYDSGKHLVIRIGKPPLEGPAAQDDWVEYFGGAGFENATSLAVDAGSNLFVAGYTTSPDLPGIGDNLINGPTDAYIVKYGPDRLVQWVSLVGGSDAEQAFGAAISPTHPRVAVVGVTSSDDFPGAEPPMSADGNDGYVFQLLTADGTLYNSRYLAGDGFDILLGVGYDGSGNIVAAGISSSTDFDTQGFSSSSYVQAYAGGDDGILAQFSPELEPQWLTYFGGAGYELITDLKIDPANGHVLIVGGTNTAAASSQNSSGGCAPPSGGVFPKCALDGAYNQFWGGGDPDEVSDAFIAEFDQARKLIWATYLGGEGREQSIGDIYRTKLAVSGNGTIAMSGIVDGAGFPFRALPGAYNTSGDGIYIAIFENKDMVWSSTFNCSYVSKVTNVDIGSDGRIYLTGDTFCSEAADVSDYCIPPPPPPFGSPGVFPICLGGSDVFFQEGNVPTFGGKSDAFLAAFDPVNFSLIWSSYFGGDGTENIFSIRAANDGFLYLVGGTYSGGDFPLRNPVNQSTYKGNGDAFVGALDVSVITALRGSRRAERKTNGIVFPNPSSGEVFVSGLEGTGKIAVFSATGAKVFETGFSGYAPAAYAIDLSNLPKGVYFIVIHDKQDFTVEKIVLY